MPRRDRDRLPARHRVAIKLRLTIGPGQGDQRRAVKTQLRSLKGKLHRRRRRMVTDNAVRQAKGKIIHRPGRRNANIPVARTARIVLNAAPGSRLQHFNHRRFRLNAVEHTRPGAAGDKRRAGGYLAQIVEIGGNTVQTGRIERLMQFIQRLAAGRRMYDQLGNHRVVIRRYFAAGRHAAVDANAFREEDFSQYAR